MAHINDKHISIEMFIHAERSSYDLSQVHWTAYQTDMSDHDGFGACVAKIMVPFDVPETFNLTAGEIEALRKQKEKLVTEHCNAIRNLNEKIAKLEALE